MRILLLIAIALISCKSQSILEGKSFYDVILIGQEMLATSQSYKFDKSEYQLSVIDNSDGQWATAVTEFGIYKIRNRRIFLTPHFKLLCAHQFSAGRDASLDQDINDKLLRLEPCRIGAMPEYVGVSRDTLSRSEIADFGFDTYAFVIDRSANKIQLRQEDTAIRSFPFQEWPIRR